MADAVKLHLGCGGVSIPGYVNIDLSTRAGVDLVADLRRLPFAQETVDFIYACAVIEHFERNEWRSVLAHWYSRSAFARHSSTKSSSITLETVST